VAIVRILGGHCGACLCGYDEDIGRLCGLVIKWLLSGYGVAMKGLLSGYSGDIGRLLRGSLLSGY